MKKAELIDYCKLNLNIESLGMFSEFPQFCEETLYRLIPYLSTEGLKVLKKEIDSIKQQQGLK